MTKNSVLVASRLVLILAFCFIAGCGIGGATKPVSVDLQKVSGEMPTVVSGVIDFDSSKMLAQNTTPFKCPQAAFSQKDLSNLKVSLDRCLKQISGSSSERVSINVMVRANMISYSNGEVAILSAVEWCLSDEQSRVIFNDKFFVSKYFGALAMKTLGGAKEQVMEKIVMRIIGTATQIENGNRTLSAVAVDDVYDSFAHAVSKLPANMTFVGIAGIPFRYKTDWTSLETMEDLNWEAIIK